MDNENNRSVSFATKAKDYYQLIKFTLSFTVVFSCVVCYLLAPNVKEFDWYMIAILFLAGMLVTGSANAIASPDVGIIGPHFNVSSHSPSVSGYIQKFDPWVPPFV